MPDLRRFKTTLSYRGTDFSGWQRQLNASSVQETIETAFSTLLQNDVHIVGCGRTDAGVHAKKYVAHFDLPEDVVIGSDKWIYKLNRMLPSSIVIHSMQEVQEDFHARHSAKSRTYHYDISLVKDPFRIDMVFQYPHARMVEIPLLQDCADLISNYNEFYPFCKAHSDTPHYLCDIRLAKWTWEDSSWNFKIEANRFLRGMVRLIVGTCLQVATSKMDLKEVKQALDNQSALAKPMSAPAAGLYLVDVTY